MSDILVQCSRCKRTFLRHLCIFFWPWLGFPVEDLKNVVIVFLKAWIPADSVHS